MLAPPAPLPDPPRMRMLVLLVLLGHLPLRTGSGASSSAQEEPRVTLEGLEPDALASGSLVDESELGLAFVEIALERDTFLVREPFTLRLRFGFETGFLRANLIQLFQRELDVPVQVRAPWLEELEGALPLEAAEPPGSVRVVLGERVVLATPLAECRSGERTYQVFELAQRYLPTRAGQLVLEAPGMRFAQATRFEDDFVQGRLPLDRRDAFVRGQGARLAILPLPEEGRPAEFSGAIGRFTLRAEAEPRELVAGQSLALSLLIESEGALGDLSESEPPRLDALADFHVRGTLVEREPRRLRVRYDLVPAGPEVRAIPPIGFAFFDTTPPAGYRRLESEPIAITVKAAPVEAESAPVAGEGAPASRRAPLVLAGLGLLALLVLFGVRRARRRARA